MASAAHLRVTPTAIPPRHHVHRRQTMKRMTLITGAALAVVASAALAFATAHAETKPVVTNHETAIKACSTVNPTQPVKIVNAVDSATPRATP